MILLIHNKKKMTVKFHNVFLEMRNVYFKQLIRICQPNFSLTVLILGGANQQRIPILVHVYP